MNKDDLIKPNHNLIIIPSISEDTLINIIYDAISKIEYIEYYPVEFLNEVEENIKFIFNIKTIKSKFFFALSFNENYLFVYRVTLCKVIPLE